MKNIAFFFKGMAMGTIDIVPGVSGSTVAVLLGFYERFIAALKNINLPLLRAMGAPFAHRFSAESRDASKKAAQDADLPWLLTLLAGIATAFVCASMIIPTLMEKFPQIMRGVFFGLVLGSILTPMRTIKPWKGRYVALLACFAAGFFTLLGHHFSPPVAMQSMVVHAGESLEMLCQRELCFLPPEAILELPQNAHWGSTPSTILSNDTVLTIPVPFYAFTVFAGFCAICAMLLPGISGSFILLVLGYYYFILHTAKSLLHALMDGTLLGAHLLQLVGIFIGGLVGIVLFSRALSWLLNHHKSATLAAIIGILLGCLRAVWPFQTQSESGLPILYIPSFETHLFIPTCVAMISGFAIVMATIYIQDRALRRSSQS